MCVGDSSKKNKKKKEMRVESGERETTVEQNLQYLHSQSGLQPAL